MRLLRSWPFQAPPGRPHVVDTIERLVIDNHHYGLLSEVDDDVLLLEWDIAVSRDDLLLFAEHAKQAPDEVLVAPYLLYPQGQWAHRSWQGQGPGAVGARPVETSDPTCNLFGLGLIYLPRRVIKGFAASGWSSHWGDCELSMWHYRHVSRTVRIAWDVRPVHLHYELPKELTDE